MIAEVAQGHDQRQQLERGADEEAAADASVVRRQVADGTRGQCRKVDTDPYWGRSASCRLAVIAEVAERGDQCQQLEWVTRGQVQTGSVPKSGHGLSSKRPDWHTDS